MANIEKLSIIFLTALGLFFLPIGLPFAVMGAGPNEMPNHYKSSEAAQVRRMLRAGCAKVKTASTQPKNAGLLLQEAASETSRALNRWRTFTDMDKAAPSSSVYAKHPNWRRSSAAIEKSMLQMKTAVKNKDPKSAMAFCGQTCRQFVELNEKAGITLTADILYKFRKAAKPLVKSVNAGDFSVIIASTDTLIALRDRAMTLFNSKQKTYGNKNDDLISFSNATDAFISAARDGDGNSISAQYKKMMSSMEAAYDRLL